MEFPETAKLSSLARNTLDLTQVQFAELLGIPVSSLQNWEQGSRSPIKTTRLLFDLILEDPNTMRMLIERVQKKSSIIMEDES